MAQPHWIRIQYDPDFKHFLVDGSYKHTPGNMFIDGFTANKRLQEYIACLMYEVEELNRKERLTDGTQRKTDDPKVG